MDELAKLIADQRRDARWGHRVIRTVHGITHLSLDDLESGKVARDDRMRRPRFREPLSPLDPRHGTWNGYTNLGCRCDRCRQAQQRHYAEKK